MFKALIRSLALTFALSPGLAAAQTFPTVSDHTVIGRIGTGSGSGPSQAIPWATLLANIAGTPAANTVFAGPTSGSAAQPAFRALVTADIPSNGVTLAKLQQGIANSIFINPTGSTANMQNVAVPACANDGAHGLVYINGTGLQCASLTTGGTVTSVTCGNGLTGGTFTTTGTCAFGFNGATLQASPGNPTGTTSTSGVMMGLGTSCHITPAFSTRVLMHVQGQMSNTTTGISANVSLRFGTGTAPVNGAAPSGSALTTGIASGVNPANYAVPFNIGGIAGGLTPGTAVWIDVVLLAGANTAAISNISCYALEL